MSKYKKKEKKPIKINYDGTNWSPSFTNGSLNTAKELLSCPQICEFDRYKLDSSKIVVVVAETATYTGSDGKRKCFKMEAGRMAAQVAHVVSKLKLSYIAWNSLGNEKDTYKQVEALIEQSITTIVLKARDSEELNHIFELASNKGLLVVEFRDENEVVYGVPGYSVLTAVAIGPTSNVQLKDVTDYLPLWKEAGEV